MSGLGKNEIVPRGRKELGFLEKIGSILKPKEMDLATARGILQLVVGTHQNSWEGNSDLNKLGLYSMKTVRDALRLVSLDTVKSHGAIFGDHAGFACDDYSISKPAALGIRVELSIWPANKPSTVSMEWGKLYNEEREIQDNWITASMPLIEPKTTVDRVLAATFADRRPEHKMKPKDTEEVVRILNMDQKYTKGYRKPFNLEEYRNSWLGLRWLTYNLLNWDKDFKFPEELGPAQPQLTQSQSRKALPSST